jgi:hypothetical protein
VKPGRAQQIQARPGKPYARRIFQNSGGWPFNMPVRFRR